MIWNLHWKYSIENQAKSLDVNPISSNYGWNTKLNKHHASSLPPDPPYSFQTNIDISVLNWLYCAQTHFVLISWTKNLFPLCNFNLFFIPGDAMAGFFFFLPLMLRECKRCRSEKKCAPSKRKRKFKHEGIQEGFSPPPPSSQCNRKMWKTFPFIPLFVCIQHAHYKKNGNRKTIKARNYYMWQGFCVCRFLFADFCA